MRRGLEAAGWLVALFAAGLGAIAVSRATAPSYTDGDVADSDFYLPLTFVLALVAMCAGYRVPRLALGLGLAAVLGSCDQGEPHARRAVARVCVGWVSSWSEDTVPIFS